VGEQKSIEVGGGEEIATPARSGRSTSKLQKKSRVKERPHTATVENKRETCIGERQQRESLQKTGPSRERGRLRAGRKSKKVPSAGEMKNVKKGTRRWDVEEKTTQTPSAGTRRDAEL